MIGIVGGGISGLALGLSLRDRGLPVVVLEAEDRAGGVIRSGRVEGRILDYGPQRTRLTPPVVRVLERVGLSDRALKAPPDLSIFVWRGGALHPVPFTPGELLRSSLLSFPGRLRALIEPSTAPLREDESVGGYFRRKLGSEAYEALVGPLFGGLYGSDPDEMYGRHALQEILSSLGIKRSLLLRALRGSLRRAGSTPAVNFPEGMEELPRAMAGALGESFVSSVRVDRLEAVTGGWRLLAESGHWEVEEVVLTVSAVAAASLLEGPAPEAARRVSSLRYNPLIMVHLVSDGPGPRGWGYQVAFGEPLRTRGVTWNEAIFGRKGVHTAFLGGARDRGVIRLGDEAIGAIARDEFREVTGLESRPISVHHTRVPSWDRSWSALDTLPELPQGLHVFANWESRIGIPARIRRAEELGDRLAVKRSRAPARGR